MRAALMFTATTGALTIWLGVEAAVARDPGRQGIAGVASLLFWVATGLGGLVAVSAVRSELFAGEDGVQVLRTRYPARLEGMMRAVYRRACFVPAANHTGDEDWRKFVLGRLRVKD